MKSHHSQVISAPSLAAAAGVLLLLGGCAVSSDPTQGGLFWSESGSRERIAERERTLQEIEGDTARTRAENAELRSDIRRY